MDNLIQVTPTKRNRRGKVVHSGQKQIVINIYKDLLKTEPDIKYDNLLNKISTKSGIGIGTIKRTIREYKSTGTLSSPVNKKNRPTVVDKVDDFDKNAIRQKSTHFGSDEKFRLYRKCYKLLKDLQFEYTKRNRNSALTEREDLILWRRKYIADIRRYRKEGKTIYFLDETWINAGDCSSRVWFDKTVKSHRDAFNRGLTTGSKNPIGRGKRLIVVHIGSTEGFVAGCLLCFESKKNTSDYHDEINGDTFFEWFCSVLPLLKDDSVIVMDNAPYHSVKKDHLPTPSWTKIKHQYDLFIIDEEAKKHNQIVLRLPPYHCELNPIELAWSVVKGHVKKNNTTYKLNDVRQLFNDGIKKVTPEMWSNFVSHTIKEEDKFWQLDFISDEMLEETQASTSHVLTITGETTSDSENSD
ncbi:uncharacterized protein LOC113558321 [Rhopalosiphum maidis]|uniref:uncharacterized protein LOC113558321 n=1 Tax=Rhopalosiphum maidis TaxID=43146 RepID=UPI000EFF9893|nr:uncharacterized protein LOC113558321 [Rhopalosiphum maidis]